ncbi:hypothetical protein DJ526_10965, partial [Sulfolobus sp. A20-N-G8]
MGSELPPNIKASFDKLYDCENEYCVQRLVDDYLNELMKGNTTSPFKLVREEIDEDKSILDEKFILNTYLFIKVLLRRIIDIDIDFEYVINDLEKRLGPLLVCRLLLNLLSYSFSAL